MTLLMKSKSPMPPTLSEDRVLALQQEINLFIDQRAAELKRTEAPDVPQAVLRAILTARSGNCECRAYLKILQHDEAAERKP
jgi:hypothetical protein